MRGTCVGALALIAASGAVAVWLWPRTPAAFPAPQDPALPIGPAPAHLTAEAARRAVRVPEELDRRYPPHTVVRFPASLDPRDFAAGIPCPGGGFLPLLNGVPFAHGIHRDVDRYGPLPPVVGKRVDGEGSDWYVHADGSETTTRWTVLQAAGSVRRDVRTDHTVPVRDGEGRPPAAR